MSPRTDAEDRPSIRTLITLTVVYVAAAGFHGVLAVLYRVWWHGVVAIALTVAAVSIVDIGSGTGRDSLWFACQGHEVLGLDYIPAATERANAAAEGLPASFLTFNLYDLRQVLAVSGELSHRDQPPVLYARFLVHALEDEGRHALWRMASMCLRRGGRFYLEFRTDENATAEKVYGEHFRKYLPGDAVVAEIEEWGGQVEHREEGYGMAVYKDEDPHVCRLVATWKR